MSKGKPWNGYEDWRRKKMHEGKVQYWSRKAAKAAVKRLLWNHEPMSAYRCEYCDAWHVGHKQEGAPSFAEWAAIDHAGVTDDELFDLMDAADEAG